MKKLLLVFLIVFSLISVISFSACAGSKVTSFAYTSYRLVDNQVAYYDSIMYGTHVYIFEDESYMPNGDDVKYKDNNAQYRMDCETNSIITIRYKRSLGVEEVNGDNATLVETDLWYFIEVSIKKSSSIYSTDKAIYLNGTKLEKNNKNDSIYDYDSLIIYHFEDCGLKRSNPNGKINGVINYIEYK